jgi:tyrosine-protein phosphatase YwqE
MEEKKEFVVYITETLQRKVIVKAVDEIDAENQVIDQYNNEEIVLNETDYLGVEFDAKEK